MATTSQLRAELLRAIIDCLEVFCGDQVVGVVSIDDDSRPRLHVYVSSSDDKAELVAAAVLDSDWNASKSL